MFTVTNWSDIIVGAFLGAIISPVLFFIFRALWARSPDSLRKKSNYIHKRMVSSDNPFWIETDVAKGMGNIISYSESRIFIIRIGNLHMNNQVYSERMNHMIEADHIWDWHFFLKNDLAAQNTSGWINDFYRIDEKKKATVIEDNSTTELGLIKRSSFRASPDIKDLFTEYGLDLNFDDLIIYGVLKGVNVFPEIACLSKDHLEKLQVEKVTLFYNDGESTKEIDCGAQKMATTLINCVTHLYDSDHRLYIDQEITEKDREKALLLIEDIMKN